MSFRSTERQTPIITTPVFIKLGGLYYGYYPLNIMFTLLVSVIVMYLIDKNIYLALLIFVLFLNGLCSFEVETHIL